MEADGSIRPPSPSHSNHVSDSGCNHLLDDDEVVVYMSKEGKTFVFDGRSVMEGDQVPGIPPVGSPGEVDVQESRFEVRDDYFSNHKRPDSWDHVETVESTTIAPVPEQHLIEDPTAQLDWETSTTTSTAPTNSIQAPTSKLGPEAVAYLQMMRRQGYIGGMHRPLRLGMGVSIAPFIGSLPLYAHRLATQPDDSDVDGGYYVPGLDAREERLAEFPAGLLPPLFLMRQSSRNSPTPPIML